MSGEVESLRSLADLLRTRAASHPDECAYIYLVDGEMQDVRITYGELDRQARQIAALLMRSAPPGARAVLLYPPDLNYVSAFFGCLYAGVIAVPAYPPDPGRLSRTLPRLQAIVSDSAAELVLTTSEILGMATFLFSQAPDLETKNWLATDALPAGTEQDWTAPPLGPESIAFLQYTSGSTGTPKGVILTHGNLLHNLGLISSAFEIDDSSVGVSWLPPYHDMGLIGGILAPLYKGRPTALMSPVAFLQRPVRWLNAISRFRATTSGGPNFAYELCLRKVTPEERDALDLSSWSVAFTGAEPVRADTLRRFVERFGPSGFEARSFYPCYGLAEATLIVTGASKGAGPVVRHLDATALQHDRALSVGRHTEDSRTLVSCGGRLGEQDVSIVRPDTMTEAAPGDVAEIWVRGGSIAKGYWGRPEETARAFGAQLADAPGAAFLRTGDLGFLRDGQLFVTGRLKDLIIVRGRNHYPQDIEQSVEESHPSLRRGCVAAFGLELGTEELLIVAVEVERRYHDRRRSGPPPAAAADRRGPDRRADNVDKVDHVANTSEAATLGAVAPAPFDPDAICDAIRRAVQERHDLHVHDVVLLPPGGVPKTSSGKIQRRACRSSYLNGTLEPVASSMLRTEQKRSSSVFQDLGPTVRGIPPDQRHGWIQEFLRQQISRTVGVPDGRILADTLVSSLGLDSLMATDLTHRLERTLKVRLTPAAFLRDVTIQALAVQVERLLDAHPSLEQQGGATSRVEEVGLSVGQQALWYLHTLAPASAAYNVSVAIRVLSELDVNVLRAAFEQLLRRHPILSTTYALAEGRLVAQVLPDAPFEYVSGKVLPVDLDRAVNELADRPFDLAAGPLLRVGVFTQGEDDHVMVVSVHHIAADLWSLVLLLHDLSAAYRPGGRGADPLPPGGTSYPEFVRWQREYLGSPDAERDWAYWEAQLRDLPTLDLPTDRARPAQQTFRGAAQAFVIAEDLSLRLRTLAAAEGTTPYVLLLSAFSLLLSRYSGQDVVAVGSPVAGRTRADFDSVVGYFVNPLVIRADLSDVTTFSALLARMRTIVLDALEHQDFPFMRLVERLPIARDPSRSPLFQVMFVLEKPHADQVRDLAHVALGAGGRRARLGPMVLESHPLATTSSQFDLSLMAVDSGDDVECRFQYNADLFDDSTITRMIGHFVNIIESAIDAPGLQLSALSLMARDELDRSLLDSRGAPLAAPSRCLHELFEAQVTRSPDAVAIVFGDACLSYRELDRRADVVASHLLTRGVGPEARVAVCIERRLELLIALLGVLKAGAVYVPVDPRYPAERQRFLLEDSGAELLLTERSLRASSSPATPSAVLIDDLLEAGRAAGPAPPRVGPSNAAYVIYTSGSTGLPKGVVIEHRSATLLCEWAHETYGPGRLSGVLAATSICFDLSVFELFAPLTCGGTVLLASNALALADLPAAPRVTLVNTVPSAMAELVQLNALPTSAETVNLAGEPLSAALVDRIYALGTVASVFDLYGPSEDTTYSTFARRAPGVPATIGNPLPGTQAYLVDRHRRPVPTGVVGELYLGGGGLARGYLGRPPLTAERFVPDFLGEAAGRRLYRTGDLARRGASGQLQFLGRIDHQIKLRGFRIELGEIEARLAARADVQEVVVAVRETESGDKRLIAYVGSETSVNASELRADLEAKLPAYMVPADFVVMAALPRTPNGKVDRRELPDPVASAAAANAPPRTPVEEVLAELAGQVLSLPQVGVTDSFFALGGHSLLAAQFVARIRESLGIELPLTALFENATVAGLADAIARGPDAATAMEAAEILLEVARMSDADAVATLDATRILDGKG